MLLTYTSFGSGCSPAQRRTGPDADSIISPVAKQAPEKASEEKKINLTSCPDMVSPKTDESGE